MTLNGYRTAAATLAAAQKRRRGAAERDAVELAKRVDLLSDETLLSLVEWLVLNCRQRGLAVVLEEDEEPWMS